MKHYISVNGSVGCIPDYCTVSLTKDQAIEALNHLEMLPDELTTLRVTGLVYFHGERCHEVGADYAEVSECDCPEPGEHQDHEPDLAWFREEKRGY